MTRWHGDRTTLGGLLAGSAIGALSVVCLAAPAAAFTAKGTETSNPSAPGPSSTKVALVEPSSASSPTGCSALLFNGQWYCNAAISDVKATRAGIGTRVVLRDVSVTRVDKTTVTVEALEWGNCSSGSYCGDLSTVQRLTVAWTGRARPPQGRVINLFGTTITGSVSPDGYVLTSGCYITYC